MTTVSRATSRPSTSRTESPPPVEPRTAATESATARNATGGSRTADAFEMRALRYDGSRPAAGTTNTNAWIPVDAPVRGSPSNRNADTYNEVLNQFAVGNNPRYTPRGGNTYCNIQHGARHGWRQVSADEAQRLANQGHPPPPCGRTRAASATWPWCAPGR